MVVGRNARVKQWVAGQGQTSSEGDRSEQEAGSDNESAGGVDEDMDIDGHDHDDTPDPTSDWDKFEELARRSTSTSKTSVRVAFLTDVLARYIKKNSLTPQQCSTMLRTLMSTYPRYVDTGSRKAVLLCVDAIIRSDLQASGKLAEATVKWLDTEVATKVCSTTSLASGSTVLSILSWITVVFQAHNEVLGTPEFEKLQNSWRALIRAWSLSYDTLLQSHCKQSIKNAGTTLSRRCVRRTSSALPSILRTLSTPASISVKPPTAAASLLGLACDVLLRLKFHGGWTPARRQGVIEDSKPTTLTFYKDTILASRTLLPEHITHSLGDFFNSALSEDDLQPDSDIVKAMDRAVLRNPEVSLSTVTAFWASWTRSGETSETTARQPPRALLQGKLLQAVLSGVKSSNANTREAAVLLFGVLLSPFLASQTPDNDLLLSIVKEITEPLKTIKTASPEHRITLSRLLRTFTSHPNLSVLGDIPGEIAQSTSMAVAKEGSESALRYELAVLGHSASALITTGQDSKIANLVAIFQKGVADSKANFRRWYIGAVGECLQSISGGQDLPNEPARTFVQSLLPSFQKILTSANGQSAASAVEGWIVAATLLGALRQWPGLEEARQLTYSTAATLKPKPSFLLSDRAWRKLANPEDEVWLVRAAQALFERALVQDASLEENELRRALPQPLLHVAWASTSHENRSFALGAIRELSTTGAASVAGVFLPGFSDLLKDMDKMVAAQTDEEQSNPPDHKPKLQSILFAIASSSTDDVFTDLLIPSHHDRVVRQSGTNLWVDFVLTAKKDPAQFVAVRTQELMTQVWEAAASTDNSFRQAAYAALSTLVFVSPGTVVPELSRHICDDLDTKHLSFVGEFERGVWFTPEGQLYIDVLASQNNTSTAASKGKNAALEKWDEETRRALAATKGSAAKLSKAQQALVEDQKHKEEEARNRMRSALSRLQRGLHSLNSLLSSDANARTPTLQNVLESLLNILSLKNADLWAQQGLKTFLSLYDSSLVNARDISLSLALSVLRTQGLQILPDELCEEALPALVLRVLYRLRFQSERDPLTAGSFILVLPLLEACIRTSGFGSDHESEGGDGTMEQLALVFDILAQHVTLLRDPLYPRLRIIEALLESLRRYPSFSTQNSATLADLGRSIKDNTTPAEVRALLQGLMVDEASARHACLTALAPLDLTGLDYSDELWIVVHDDEDERSAQQARDVWDENGLDVIHTSYESLLPYLSHKSSFVRQAAARAFADSATHESDWIMPALNRVVEQYREAAKERLPEYDAFGMLIESSLGREDPWRERTSLARALQFMTQSLDYEVMKTLFALLIEEGALGDRSEAVRSCMLEAGIAAIDAHGRDHLQAFMDMFQGFLSRKKPATETSDRVTEAVIVLLGRLARHLDSSDERLSMVIDRLLAALKTPSEAVQVAVSECLPPLVRVSKQRGASIITGLVHETLHASKYAERRGAAYGLAGAVKGRGISSISELDIVGQLQEATENKKDANARQGAMFAFETLSSTLGRLFEPYIIKIVPTLLTCLGDSSPDVREATSDVAKVIMSNLSGHAVKMILPILLDALDDRQWRTKKGAIELMGAMAYLAPRQLSQSLPNIIPPLTEVLTDTHTQVRAAANSSLKKFGEVVNNPEIQAMQSTLLGALVDPARKTGKALDVLLTTSFVHYIDASSLALVIPIIERGLRERASELKKKGAQIVGNMAALTDAKDLTFYLPNLIPRMHEVLVDPVPEARATAAKALGVLVDRLGEGVFPTLVDDLMDTLKSDKSGVDQQGAAQGLSEVLCGLGVDRMEEMLPEILRNTASPRAYVREGFISLLVYLPSVFGDRFSPYLSRIIQPILSGLADDSEYVREASMRAGRMIVANHSAKAIDLLLPELETGLFDDSWRIRLSSLQLVGELLFRISGISAKTEVDQDANEEDEDAYVSNAEAARKISDSLGKDRRDRVLSSLYILRQDSAGQVRLSSISIWKALVSNTPRTVKEMLPALMQHIIKLLSSSGEDQREAATRTLADLVRKQGERILGDVIPILQQASKGSTISRHGASLAFAEILQASSKTQLEGHEDDIVESVRSALVDEEPVVRQAAAQAFDALQAQIGPRSIDQTIPTLLQALTERGAASEAALSALRELMSVRAQAIFPVLIPTLIAQPISSFNAKALASLVTVAGSALNKRLSQILDALQRSIDGQLDESHRQDLKDTVDAVLSSVTDAEGLHQLMLNLLGLSQDPRATKRISGCTLFASFCAVTEEDFSAYHIDWTRQLVSLYADSDENVVKAAISAMEAFVRTLSKEDMESIAVSVRRALDGFGAPGQYIMGFAYPGGLKPVLTILTQGLLAGTNEQREQSALAMGDVVEKTSPEALKPHVTQMTGPLIRIIAERYPAPVKAAILSTLTILLQRVPQYVRPFFPQLQRTFVKNLSDLSSITVRNRAVAGLGALMAHQPRIDPLLTELLSGTKSEEQDVRESTAKALAAVVHSGGANLGPAARDALAQAVQEVIDEPGKENFNNAIARTIAAMVHHEMTQSSDIIAAVLDTKPTPLTSMAILDCLEEAPHQLFKYGAEKIVSRILKNVIVDHPGVARPAREARELLKRTSPFREDSETQARIA